MANKLTIGFYEDGVDVLPNINSKISINLTVTDDKNYFDSSETLYQQTSESDENGLVSFDLSDVIKSATFSKFYRLYSEKYKIEFRFVIETLKAENYNYFITKGSFSPEYLTDKETSEYFFEDYDYTQNVDFFYLTPKDPNQQKTITSLKAEYKVVEMEYLVAKTLYETEIKSTTEISLEKENDYEPSTFKNIITRLLEFQVGTLEPGIKYTSEAKLTDINTKLTNISKLINLIIRQYPDVKIEDGEGFPYQSQKIERL